MDYHELRGVSGAAVGIVLICALVTARGANGIYFRIGPCTDDKNCPTIFGVKCDSWSVWMFLSSTLVVKEILLAYGNNTYRFWVANELMDKKSKSPITHPKYVVVGMVIIWKAFQHLAMVLEVSVASSLDAQFICMSFVAETAVYVSSTIRVLNQKGHEYDSICLTNIQ